MRGRLDGIGRLERERANRQVSVSRRERAAKLKRTGEDGYLGRIKTVTRTQRATRLVVGV